MTSSIQLAKPYTPKKLEFPVMVSEKLDGVPVRMDFSKRGTGCSWLARTRQDKPVPSVREQVRALCAQFASLERECFDITIVAETTHTEKGMPFKDVSGHVRRQEQNDDLVLNIFDASGEQAEDGFGRRIAFVESVIRGMGSSPAWRMIPQMICRDFAELGCALKAFTTEHDGWLPEGAVVRNMNELWQPGKRTWGYQKYVIDPTTEVWITGYEEALSATGERLGMVGRLNGLWYDGGLAIKVGVGPGKLTHKDRRNLWTMGWAPAWATVKYKRDPSYDKLRQPTFQHWRPDYEEDE